MNISLYMYLYYSIHIYTGHNVLIHIMVHEHVHVFHQSTVNLKIVSLWYIHVHMFYKIYLDFTNFTPIFLRMKSLYHICTTIR